jgi:quinol monooxygenase YgiN
MKRIISLISVALIATVCISCCGKKSDKCCAEQATAKTIKLVIAASVEIQPDKADQFRQFAEGLVSSSRAETGNISYTMYEDVKEKNKFFFFEEWKDQAAVDTHFAAPHFKDFGALLNEIGVKPPTVKIMEVSAEK